LELQSLGFQPHTVERISCSTSESEKKKKKNNNNNQLLDLTAAPCLDPSGKQEHRHSRGDAAITRLSSTAPRGSKNKQTNKPPKRRKQGSKKSKLERRKIEEEEDEGPSVESGDEYVRMYPEVLYSRISPSSPPPQVPAQNGSL
jgi:hypothetical protein